MWKCQDFAAGQESESSHLAPGTPYVERDMRKISVGTALLACALVACTQQPKPQTTATMVSSGACAGEDYLEVTNNTGKAIEVYADLGGFDGEFIGTMPTDSVHLTLNNTTAQGRSAKFYATVDGIKYTQAYVNSPVQMIRRCSSRLGTSNDPYQP